MKFAQNLTLFLVNKETPSELNECSGGYCIADFVNRLFIQYRPRPYFFYHRNDEFAFLYKSRSEIAKCLMKDISLFQTFRRILKEYQENASSPAGKLTFEYTHYLPKKDRRENCEYFKVVILVNYYISKEMELFVYPRS